MIPVRVLAAAAAAVVAATGASGESCAPKPSPPADCHSPAPYSLYDRPGHGIRGLVQIICDTQPRTYNVHVTLEYKYRRFGTWQVRDHNVDYYSAPAGPVVGRLYEYEVGYRCQEGYWRMVVFAEGTSSDDVPQRMLRFVPGLHGMRVRHCR
jgi:hypothetical protein